MSTPDGRRIDDADGRRDDPGRLQRGDAPVDGRRGQVDRLQLRPAALNVALQQVQQLDVEVVQAHRIDLVLLYYFSNVVGSGSFHRSWAAKRNKRAKTIL